MDEIRIQEVVIQSQESSLIISDSSQPGLNIKLDASQLPKLIEFLNSHSSDPGVEEKRIGFRVPFADLSQATRENFRIAMEIGGAFVEARPIDVSITGAQVEISGHSVLLGDSFPTAMRYRNQVVTVNAKVVRTHGAFICLHFPSALTHGKLNPPEALLNVYRALELDWLRERVS